MNLRIRCKAPEPAPRAEPGSKYPIINGLLASLTDTTIHLVMDDGTEKDISPLVRSVKWQALAGPPAFATLEFYNCEVDLEGLATEAG